MFRIHRGGELQAMLLVERGIGQTHGCLPVAESDALPRQIHVVRILNGDCADPRRRAREIRRAPRPFGNASAKAPVYSTDRR